jgi:hypothetical protein
MAQVGQPQTGQRDTNHHTDGKPPCCKQCKRTNHKTAMLISELVHLAALNGHRDMDS